MFRGPSHSVQGHIHYPPSHQQYSTYLSPVPSHPSLQQATFPPPMPHPHYQMGCSMLVYTNTQLAVQNFVPPLPQLMHMHTAHPGMAMDTEEDNRSDFRDPQFVVVPSIATPYAIEMALNSSVISCLRKGWGEYIPMAYFASRFADSSSVTDQGESLVFEVDKVKVKSKRLVDYPISKIMATDFTEIAAAYPRAVFNHFIPGKSGCVGTPKVVNIASMIKGLFRLVTTRPDFIQNFETYKQYIEKALRDWFNNKEKNNQINLFHENLYQMTFNTECRKLATAVSEEQCPSSSSPSRSRASKRSF
ncbi:hypothetical protein BT96DRAFT_998742 [Gymnopus androsaceus JB14]|uniref:Uncharacterized protein n=1 Tax=Gymnopus androsaceus JB14 TaxID=1447944 RepID=A0A6A4HAN2_9AGAR|nr:hypothetical protein BT96DRAFT_998742 [Gymnopus androsaceus JB14]